MALWVALPLLCAVNSGRLAGGCRAIAGSARKSHPISHDTVCCVPLQAEALRRESESRLGEYGDLKARLRESQARVEELEALKSAWREEWDRVKSAHRQQVQDLAAAVQSLQGRLK